MSAPALATAVVMSASATPFSSARPGVLTGRRYSVEAGEGKLAGEREKAGGGSEGRRERSVAALLRCMPLVRMGCPV